MVKLRANTRMVENENGVLLLDVRRGNYWHLNVVAKFMVDALISGRGSDEVVSEMALRFQVDAATVHEDLKRLVHDLKKAKLVEGAL